MEISEKYTKLVNDEISKLVGKDNPEELYEPMQYHLTAGGKRVRPVLCMLACEAVGGTAKAVVPVAAALELMHAFTLVHDDVMDRDDLRRGRETIWKKWGEALAINVGDGIFAKAYESALNLDVEPSVSIEILKKFTKTILEVCEGQALDVNFEDHEEVSFEEYVKMSTKKTASLISTSLEIGAIAGGGSDEQVNALAEYGKLIGLAFQVWDDYIDFASENTGKTVGSDIKKGKKTSIVCHAIENLAEGEKKKRLLEILKTPVEDTNDDLIKEAVSILNECGSIEYAKNYAKDLVKKAKEQLSVLEESDAKKKLEEFANYIVSRED